MTYQFMTQNICPSLITFDLDGQTVTNISFTGGCNGNLKAISKLLDGQSVDYIEEMLLGNTCGRNYTSCADQLARAVRVAWEEEQKASEETTEL
ncbi:MAG: TIGR03905 family TSCPD domain-containing protein [Lachnospiraceae bacterium]|nr:TIGR03905 family TSCPD domain-containing protein [Lachnospiraceae bacterium]